jgi:hypothetical protein
LERWKLNKTKISEKALLIFDSSSIRPIAMSGRRGQLAWRGRRGQLQ